MRTPVIALVGRPNVGKSRMFNRLVGGQEAIVEDTPGVTRDRHYGECDWYGRLLTVVDTGGFEPESEDRLLEQMREQAMLAVEEADAIIFMVDGRAGCMPQDEAIAHLLRRSETPVYVAVNKLDTPTLAASRAEFYSLGFESVHAVSAEHGLGIDELMDELAEVFPRYDREAAAAARDEGTTRVAVVGKPNAGKSTLINRLLGSERLLTSDIPGTTRDAIDTLVERDGKRYVLVDTAGIRRKRSISLQLEKFSVFRAIRSVEQADVALLVIDATEGVSDQDAKIARLIDDRGTAMAILLNKWDAVEDKETNTAARHEQRVRERLPFCDYAPLITISARTGQRSHRLLDLVDRLDAAAEQRVATAELNRTLEQIVAQHQPPVHQNRRVRFYYATQVGVRPPTIVIQVNQPEGVPTHYRRYLVNKLREAYGFEGSTIRLLLRKPKGRRQWEK